jgi:hypothetical protein
MRGAAAQVLLSVRWLAANGRSPPLRGCWRGGRHARLTICAAADRRGDARGLREGRGVKLV